MPTTSNERPQGNPHFFDRKNSHSSVYENGYESLLNKSIGSNCPTSPPAPPDYETYHRLQQQQKNRRKHVQLNQQSPPHPSNQENTSFIAKKYAEEEKQTHERYDIVWEFGLLGLTFRPPVEDGQDTGSVHSGGGRSSGSFSDYQSNTSSGGGSGRKRAQIRRINKKGNAVGIEKAQVGDILVGINGKTVAEWEFEAIVSFLKDPTFPITLTFDPPTAAQSPNYSHSDSRGSNQDTSDSFLSNVAESVISYAPSAHPRKKNLPPSTPTDIDVIWEGGVLGITLKNSNGVVTVKGASGKGDNNHPILSRLDRGDHLIFVNDSSTADLGFKKTMEILKFGKKPIFLRFRTNPSLYENQESTNNVNNPNEVFGNVNTVKNQEYSVIWNDGPLGVVLKKNSNDQVYIHRGTGQGLAKNSQYMNPGDIFVSIAAIPVAKLGLSQTVEFLKTVQRPVKLVFEHASSNNVTSTDLRRSGPPPLHNQAISSFTNRSENDYQSRHSEVSRPNREFYSSRSLTEIETQHTEDFIVNENSSSGVSRQSSRSSTPTNRQQHQDYTRPPSLERVVSNSAMSSYSDLDDSGIMGKTSRKSHHDDERHESRNLMLNWVDGPLGMTMKKINGKVAISRLTGRGYTKGLSELLPGDYLISIKNYKVEDLGFNTTMNLLKSLPKPVELEFSLLPR